jgi:hypothetical protein
MPLQPEFHCPRNKYRISRDAAQPILLQSYMIECLYASGLQKLQSQLHPAQFTVNPIGEPLQNETESKTKWTGQRLIDLQLHDIQPKHWNAAIKSEGMKHCCKKKRTCSGWWSRSSRVRFTWRFRLSVFRCTRLEADICTCMIFQITRGMRASGVYLFKKHFS